MLSGDDAGASKHLGVLTVYCVHNEEMDGYSVLLLTQYCAVRVIRSRRMRWAGHVLRMGER
jgi:hypothetical protein